MRLKQFAVLIALSFVAAGCGGGGLLSPFIGTYNGNWTQSSPSDSGATSFVILGGNINGSLHDSNANADYTISGTISNGGVVNATISPPGGNLAGTLSFNGSNQLEGTLTDSSGPFNSMAFTMTQQ